MARDTTREATSGMKLRAVHRIEGSDGKVILPGQAFIEPDAKEGERLMRLGAATEVVAEEAAEA